MKLVPIITEKSLKEAKEGRYTFRVERSLTKPQIKELIEKAFTVHVVRVHTLNIRGEAKRTASGRKRVIQPIKKAVIELKDKEKLDMFEESK